LIAAAFRLASCQTVDLYEKNIALPKQAWSTSFKPQFSFTIKDTTASYQLYVVLRHNEQYNYNNIWLNLYAQAPGQPAQKFMIELPLATTEKGWLGTGMDDLYEHRIPVTIDPSRFNFDHAGNYRFTLEQVMREDPLEHVFNVGLRIEKKPQ
jgi:gliding motility-associated lipoprotein GldH